MGERVREGQNGKEGRNRIGGDIKKKNHLGGRGYKVKRTGGGKEEEIELKRDISTKYDKTQQNMTQYVIVQSRWNVRTSM